MKEFIITRGIDTSFKNHFVNEKITEGFTSIYTHDLSNEDTALSHVLSETGKLIDQGVDKIILYGENLRTKPVRKLAEKAMDHGYEFFFADFPIAHGIDPDSEMAQTKYFPYEGIPIDYEKAVHASIEEPDHIKEIIDRFPYDSWVSEEVVKGKYAARSVTVNPEDYVPYENDRSLPKSIIVDIDGTVADNPIIDNGFMERPQREFSDYTKNIMKDTPIQQVIDNVNFYHDNGVRVIIITGRDEVSYDFNVQWFKDHGMNWDEMYCRGHDDYRDDWQVKDDFIRDHVENKYHVMAVFDDRQQVVDHLRNMGLTVFQVAPSDF